MSHHPPIQPWLHDLMYSLRRRCIDDFFCRQSARIPSGALALDVGGAKIGKRGQFDISRCDLQVVYANLSPV